MYMMPNPCVAERSPEIKLLGIFLIVTDKTIETLMFMLLFRKRIQSNINMSDSKKFDQLF